MEKTSFNRLVDMKFNLLKKGFSKDSIDIISASWRESTSRQYQYAWKLWATWCLSNDLDPLNSSVQDVLNFLSIQFKSGKSYSILNTYRSSISSIHSKVNNTPIGQHELVIRFFKGLANLRPSIPRYSVTWDVDRVLLYLESQGELDDLSLKMLTCRTVTLVSLVTAQRSQTLKFLNLSNMKQDSSGITFSLDKLTKTDKPGHFRKLFIPCFKNKRLCVVTSINAYISKTRILRKSNQLFVSFRKPHDAVTTSTLAKWIIFIMNLSGIDCSSFKAHSVRSAVTSKTVHKGFSVHELMKCGLWRTENTFKKFYLKDIKSKLSNEGYITKMAETVLVLNRE